MRGLDLRRYVSLFAHINPVRGGTLARFDPSLGKGSEYFSTL